MRSSNNVDSVLSKKTCEGFCDTTNIRKAGHGGGFIFNKNEKYEGINSGEDFFLF